MPSPAVPSIPPLSSITDPNTRAVLQAIVDGQRIRNLSGQWLHILSHLVHHQVNIPHSRAALSRVIGLTNTQSLYTNGKRREQPARARRNIRSHRFILA